MSDFPKLQPEAQAEGIFHWSPSANAPRGRKQGLPSLALRAGVCIMPALLMAFATPAYAVDHGLLTSFDNSHSVNSLLDKPAVASNQPSAEAAKSRSTSPSPSPIKLTQQIRRRPAAPDPDLLDGQQWLCSVGQTPAVNVEAFRRAKAKGWGYWSFAAHARCPPGVYLTIAQGGALQATGENVWTDEPSPGDPLANYTAMPSMSQARRAIPAAHVMEYRQPRSNYYVVSGVGGFNFGSGESNASCAACIDGACASSGVPSDYARAAWSYAGDSGGSIAGSSSGYCASCNGR